MKLLVCNPKSIECVDMRSQGGLLLEDLMKFKWSTFELSWSHYHWNEAFIHKEKRFDGIHVDQGWNVCFPHSYIIKKVYLKFVIHIVDLVALIRCIWSLVCPLICWMIFQHI